MRSNLMIVGIVFGGVSGEHEVSIKSAQTVVNDLRDERKQEKADALNDKKELAKNKMRCEQAKKQLANYQHPKVNIKESDGNYRAIGEEERQAGLKKSEELVKKSCNY